MNTCKYLMKVKKQLCLYLIPLYFTPMLSHSELTDELFEQQFESCKFDPELFTHEAHLRLAYIHIKKYGLAAATENVCRQLINYVDYLGVGDKYNKTLTVAAIKAVNHFINRSATDNFASLVAEFPRLKYNFRELMAAHYSTDIYNSAVAKATFLEPQLLPFS